MSITMVSFSPKDRVVGPLPNGRTPWLINGGDPNYLFTGPRTDRYKWSYKPNKWPYKWVTGVISPINGVMGPYL